MNVKNPMFSSFAEGTIETSKASFRGILAKTSLLLVISISIALYIMISGFNSLSYVMLSVGSIVGFISVMIGRMNPKAAPICGLIYAVCEGLFLGCISAIAETYYPGAAAIAIVATFSIFIVMLVLYNFKIVQATPMLYKVLSTVGLSIMVFMLIAILMNLFGATFLMDMFVGNSTFSAILAAIFIAYGSFMLVANFEEARTYAENGFDKKYEWCAALGLIVTLIYIYIQVLRFVMIILSNRD